MKNRVYEVRYGRECKMYTLWVVITLPRAITEHYIQNLSIDYETAIKKATERANGDRVNIDAPDCLQSIIYGKSKGLVVPWGKYKDMKIEDIDDEKYLIWIFKGANVKNDNGDWYPKLMQDDNLRLNVQELLLNRGVLTVYNDKVVTKEWAAKLEEMKILNSNSDFVGSIGDKLELEVTLERLSYYEGNYGTVWIYQFRDDDSNVIIYKGQNLNRPTISTDTISGLVVDSNNKKFWKGLIHIGVENGRYHTNHNSYNTSKEDSETIRGTDFKGFSANYINPKNGEFYNFNYSDIPVLVKDRLTISGSIKEHSEYKETKQTILQRVKILK